MILVCVVVVMALCVGLFGAMRLVNRKGTAGPSSWKLQAGGMEILAAPMGSTLEQSGGQGMLPFLSTEAPTATPLPRPTVPTATKAPEVTPEPAAEPTAAAATAKPTAEAATASPEPAATEQPTSITITAVGDCTLGGDIPSGAYRDFKSYAERYGPDYFFANVRSLFESDDLTIVNLEGPLTNSTEMRQGRTFNFRGYPQYALILSGSSVEICNVANNHALDFGQAGLDETAAVLEAQGIGVSGFRRVYWTEINGIRVCSVGFTEWAYSQEEIVKAIRMVRGSCDLLIVSMHWGEESRYQATALQKRLGHAIVDAGADLVIGNHSHVCGGIEQYKGKCIIYSLGNFCFGGNRNPKDKNCTIFQQRFVFDEDGNLSDSAFQVIPAFVSSTASTNNYQPTPLTGDAAARQLQKLIDISRNDAA